MATNLSAHELQRVIVRAGGLYSPAELTWICATEGAKRWPSKPDFPNPAWITGQSKLYAGWEVHEWLEQTGQLAAAERLYRVLRGLRVRKNLLA